MAKGCFDSGASHVVDSVYRDHEIVVSKCNNCPDFIVDVRSDNSDGQFIAGYIDSDIVQAVRKALVAVDEHEVSKQLLLNIPF